MTKIKVYGKIDCIICKKCKEKIKILGFEYEDHSLDWHTKEHTDWRNDDTVKLMEFCSFVATDHVPMPIVFIDGEYYLYAEAMKKLKEIKNAK